MNQNPSPLSRSHVSDREVKNPRIVVQGFGFRLPIQISLRIHVFRIAISRLLNVKV